MCSTRNQILLIADFKGPCWRNQEKHICWIELSDPTVSQCIPFQGGKFFSYLADMNACLSLCKIFWALKMVHPIDQQQINGYKCNSNLVEIDFYFYYALFQKQKSSIFHNWSGWIVSIFHPPWVANLVYLYIKKGGSYH